MESREKERNSRKNQTYGPETTAMNLDGLILILLAAGDSRRFHGNKLLHAFHGKPMYQYLADEIDRLPKNLFAGKIVVTQYQEIMDDLGSRGYQVVENQESTLGISHSIKLGIRAAEAWKGGSYCFAVCDQPHLKAETVKQLIEGYRESKKGIGCLAKGETLGNPVVFSNRYREELLALAGDVGGKKVLKKHRDDLYRYEVEDRIELEDIDINSGVLM